jgi:RNA polymerase sigma factor (sigma-70 family)
MTSAGQATLSVCSRRLLEGTGSFRQGSFRTLGRYGWEQFVTESKIPQTVKVTYPDLEVHRPDLCRLLEGLGAKKQDVADLVQQTFAQVVAAVQAGELIFNTGGYCFRVATRVFHSYGRQRRASRVQYDSVLLESRAEQTPEVLMDETQNRVLAAEEIDMFIQEVEDLLGPKDSAVLQLLYGGGGDDEEEFAREMGVSKYHIRRLRTKINKLLATKREGN